jgi:glycosyltransferase involved in cell wall biosynthesis
VTPTVSVIVPAYRVTAFIAETLDSALAQTRRDLEIVVVNDGCPDTAGLERALAPYAARITYLRQANAGPSAARNAGVAAAQGRFLAFLDGDDLWDPAFLETQVAALERDDGTILVYCDSQPFGVPGAGPSLMRLEPASGPCDLAALLTGRRVVVTSTAVTRRQAVLDAGGFDEGLRHCEDFDLWLRLATRGTFLRRTDVLGRRRLHASSQSSSPETMLRAQVAVRQRFLAHHAVSEAVRAECSAADRRCEAEIALHDGRRLLAAGNVAGARRELAKAARELPGVRLAAMRRLLDLAPPLAVALQRWRRAGRTTAG